MEIRRMVQIVRKYMKIALDYSSIITHNLAHGNKD